MVKATVREAANVSLSFKINSKGTERTEMELRFLFKQLITRSSDIANN